MHLLRFVRSVLVAATLVVGACGEDATRTGSGQDVSAPVDACVATLAEGEPCDDGDRCTVDDRCQAGACVGAVVPRESFSCDGVDDDCDGHTDEDCRLRLSGTVVGAGGADYPGLHQAVGTRTAVGRSSNSSFTLEATP